MTNGYYQRLNALPSTAKLIHKIENRFLRIVNRIDGLLLKTGCSWGITGYSLWLSMCLGYDSDGSPPSSLFSCLAFERSLEMSQLAWH